MNLVIRYSSLGDIVLTGAVTGALAPVTYLTAPRFRALAAALPGVTEVICHGVDPLPARADRIVDLHASPRSRWASVRIRGPVHRVRRHDVRRRLRVALKLGAPPPPVVARYARAAGVTPASWPFLSLRRAATPDAMVLCPGAAHPTKIWPVARYVALGLRWGGPVVVLGGPSERDRVRSVVDGIGSHAEGIAEAGFTRTFAAAPRGRVAIGGDTGLMHLCAAAGIPTVTLFGPTTAADGFWSSPGEVVEHPLPCRPCSRHGRPTCPFGDHLCLRSISVDTVWEATQRCAG